MAYRHLKFPEDSLFLVTGAAGFAAGVIMEEYGGKMPEQYEELLKLPGIGSYTAGAVSSIAFGHPVPAVDGNVLRVISRVTASREDILKASTKKWMETHLRETMPKNRASHFNQVLAPFPRLRPLILIWK